MNVNIKNNCYTLKCWNEYFFHKIQAKKSYLSATPSLIIHLFI